VLLENVPLHIRRESWLLQDGATPRFGRQITAFLSIHFQNRWSGRQDPVAWPLRSPDFTPLDYCSLGRMKSLVYAVKSIAQSELLNRIMDAFAHIRNDEPSLMGSVTSHEGPQCAQIIRDVILISYFNNIRISTS
jgi:hypothetical protein